MGTIRVLLADDHPVFRFGLKPLLGAAADLAVVGEEALALANDPMQAGPRGCLLKDAEAEATLRAIRTVADGQASFSPTASRRVIDCFARRLQRTALRAAAEWELGAAGTRRNSMGGFGSMHASCQERCRHSHKRRELIAWRQKTIRPLFAVRLKNSSIDKTSRWRMN